MSGFAGVVHPNHQRQRHDTLDPCKSDRRSDYSIRVFMLRMKALYILIGDRLCDSE